MNWVNKFLNIRSFYIFRNCSTELRDVDKHLLVSLKWQFAKTFELFRENTFIFIENCSAYYRTNEDLAYVSVKSCSISLEFHRLSMDRMLSRWFPSLVSWLFGLLSTLLFVRKIRWWVSYFLMYNWHLQRNDVNIKYSSHSHIFRFQDNLTNTHQSKNNLKWYCERFNGYQILMSNWALYAMSCYVALLRNTKVYLLSFYMLKVVVF